MPNDNPAPAYVYVRRTRCPACKSDDLHGQGTRMRKTETVRIDGATYRKMVCRQCGHRFTKITHD